MSTFYDYFYKCLYLLYKLKKKFAKLSWLLPHRYSIPTVVLTFSFSFFYHYNSYGIGEILFSIFCFLSDNMPCALATLENQTQGSNILIRSFWCIQILNSFLVFILNTHSEGKYPPIHLMIKLLTLMANGWFLYSLSKT